MKRIGWIVIGFILLGALVFGTVGCNGSTTSNTSNAVNNLENKYDLKNEITNQVKANNIELSKLEVVSSKNYN